MFRGVFIQTTSRFSSAVSWPVAAEQQGFHSQVDFQFAIAYQDSNLGHSRESLGITACQSSAPAHAAIVWATGLSKT